ncbi:hypothetical protein ABPG74_007609 [Tetrahymena malaccensis]
MDVRKSFPYVRQNQHVLPKNQQCQRGMKRSKDQVFQFVNLIQQVTQILTKERTFRTKEEVSLVAIVIKQSNFFRFYEKDLEKSPSAFKQIVESMSYESYIPGQEIYTEKDRAKKVYIVLSGDVCILSQKMKKDRFKNISETKNINSSNKSDASEQLNSQLQMKLKQLYESELHLEKSFSHSFNQFKQLESISQYDFFGDTDVRYLSKHSFSAIAKTRVECAVIPQEVFNVYLGETKIIFKEGEKSSEVYYIKQGDIELSATLPKESDQEIKVEDIETNIAAQTDNNDNAIDSFDPEKFIKSNLFNQTLYEKGGPVSKIRQFWNQGDTEGQDYITKLKEQLDFKCKQFQQRGIQYTQIKVEDQVKKFMIASLSNRFQDKERTNFFSQAINRNVSSGLKLALLSKGGYFGEEIIFQHPLLLENSSPTISPQIKENKKQKSQNYFFDELKINQKQLENINSKHGNKNFLGQKNESKQNQAQELELENNYFRQYTVKCQSASCILLKIEMELYLSLIYLNQKQTQAKKYLEGQLKQERRQIKLKNHLKLILKPNKVFTQQNETDQAPSSIKAGKSFQFFTSSNSNQQLAYEDPSTPNSKKLELLQKSYMSQNFNNQLQMKKQDTIDASSSVFPLTDKNQQNSQTKNIQANETRQKNNSECLSVPAQLNNYQINKIKQRNSIDKMNMSQSQDIQNVEGTNTNVYRKMSFKNNNNSLQYYRQSHYNNQSQQDFSEMFGQYAKQEGLVQKKNLADQNLKQLKQGINQSKTAQKQSQMREEIDNLYYTFSSILQKEENRQRQISLMTNSLEKICNNNYYYKSFQKDNQKQGLSITLPNQNVSEQNVQKEFQFFSPIQSAQKGMEKVFFSSHYSQLSQLINYSNNDNKTAASDQIKKNTSFSNQTQNTKLSFKKQTLNQSRDFGSQSEQINPIIQKQKLLVNSDIIKIKNDLKKHTTCDESEQNNKQIEMQFNESRESFKSKLISSSTNENEQNPKSISFQSKEQIQNNQKDDFNLDQEKVFVFDQQNSPINNQISFLQNSFISIQEDDKDQLLLQTNSSQQDNTNQKKFLIRDKNVLIYPKKYVLQPLFSEIIENEVERLQQSEQKKQNERIKIEINQDFYIKRYRKAYKEAFDLVKRPEKKQVNSIFDDLENSSEKQNKKQSQENLSLILQKKFQIDKRFPNSKRAKEISDFFSNHIKKLDEQHKSKLDKFKREKDINAIITKQLVHKLEQQNIKRRNDLHYAGTNFNFILKDTDKKNSIISKNNNISQENQNQKQVK